MIVVTGGAGFIGSNLVAALNQRGVHDVVVCDTLGTGDKWRNLAKHEIADLIAPKDLARFLLDRFSTNDSWGRIDAVFHLGAVSSTTEDDADLILNQNFVFSLMLWRLCSEHRVRLIYASSAATYGDGAAGFDDDHTIEGLARLRPLNAYGWSKHLFDRRAARLAQNPDTRPPQWVGLKFFNVYGPNEYHKGDMQSVIAQKFPFARDHRPVTLFKSGHEKYPDGGQMRDFVYVRDCVDVMLWLYEHAEVNGLFNLGTGRARSFDDLAAALFAALGTDGEIAYIDLPPEIHDRYQYFTQADMSRLRNAGYSGAFASLEEGVADYVRGYLMGDDPYR